MIAFIGLLITLGISCIPYFLIVEESDTLMLLIFLMASWFEEKVILVAFIFLVMFKVYVRDFILERIHFNTDYAFLSRINDKVKEKISTYFDAFEIWLESLIFEYFILIALVVLINRVLINLYARKVVAVRLDEKL